MTDRNKRRNLDDPVEEDKDAVDELDRFDYRPSNYYKDLQESHTSYCYRVNNQNAIYSEIDRAIISRRNPNRIIPTA
jgi:hypothetical protein